MLHKHLLDFTRKYNKEFAIKGYSKLKKADLQTKIESVLNKQRKEIKEEYKQLKQMKAEPKKTIVKKEPVKKPVVKKTPVKKEPVKKTPVKKTPVKKPVVKKEPVKKPVVKKEPVKKPVVKKETKPKPAPKKEYKFTKDDILRLKDWADLHKRKYSTMDTIYKKEILFELKRNDIFRKLKPKTDAEYRKMEVEEDKLFDKMYPEEAEPKKETKPKPAPKPAPKKEPVKKNNLDFSVLNFSAKKTYEDATKELIEYNKELKMIEENKKKGNLSKTTKEYYEDRIKFLNKNININNKEIKRIEDSIKRRMKRDVKINDFEKEGYKKVMKDHERILEEVKKTNNINELDKLGNELNKNVGLMKKGYYKDDNIVKKFNKLNNDIIEILKKKSKELMPKQKEKKEIKFTGKSIKITGDEIIKKVKEIKKTEPKKETKKEPVKKETKKEELDLTKEQQEVLLQASNHFYNDTPIYEKINELKIKYFDTLDKKYINEMLKLKNDYNTTKTKARKIEKEIKQKELKERKKVEVDIKKFTEKQKLDFIKKYDMYYEGSKDKILIDFLATDAKAKKSPPAQKQRKDLIEKRFNNLHPEIILTQADEKAVAKNKTNDKRTYEQLTKFYDTIGTLLGGRRVYNTTKKELAEFGFDADDIDKLLQAQKYGDFYPTPAHCIQDELLIDRIKKADYVFDPTAGLGNLIFHTLKYNKDLKVDVNEMNDNSSKLLNKLLGSYINNIYTQDYLKMKVDKSYDLYVLNPPFGYGGDKKFYYNFYFKMLYDINTTKKNSQITHGIFISPPLTDHREKEGEVIQYWDIMSGLSVKKIDDILNNQFKFGLNKKQIEKISKNNYEDDDEINEVLDYFSVLQVQKIKTCSGFAGTGMNAIVYLVIA